MKGIIWVPFSFLTYFIPMHTTAFTHDGGVMEGIFWVRYFPSLGTGLSKRKNTPSTKWRHPKLTLLMILERSRLGIEENQKTLIRQRSPKGSQSPLIDHDKTKLLAPKHLKYRNPVTKTYRRSRRLSGMENWFLKPYSVRVLIQ